MNPISRRKWMLGATAATVGCDRRRRASADNSITILYPYNETVLGPEMDMPAKHLVFLPLFRWNRHAEVEGRLAEHWEHSADFRDWTIRLRNGIRWHDGVPVTAHDVKFTYEIPWAALGSDAPCSVRVLDDLTCSITYRRKVAEVLDDWTVCLPKHIAEQFDPKDYYSWDFWTHPIGNGPYRHHRTIAKTMIELRANPDYYLGTPKVERIVLKLAGDNKATGILELRSGGVDAAPYLNRADVLAMVTDSRFRCYSHMYNDLAHMLFWNHRHELFHDPRIRRALTLGINRRELMQALNFPADTPVVDSLFSTRQMWRREFPEPTPYNPVLARQLLDAAGWQLRNPEGIRERNGMPFTFTALVGSALFDSDSTATIYVQSELKRLGIKMNVKPLDNAFSRVITGDYEAAFHRMFTDWTPDDKPYGNGAERFLHGAGYRSPRFDELANEFRNTFDPNQEDRLYGELARLFQEDAPAVFLYPDVYTTVASARIRGLEDSPYRGDLTWCMDQLWLEGQS